jgi:hypothetical protein
MNGSRKFPDASGAFGKYGENKVQDSSRPDRSLSGLARGGGKMSNVYPLDGLTKDGAGVDRLAIGADAPREEHAFHRSTRATYFMSAASGDRDSGRELSLQFCCGPPGVSGGC